MATIENSAVIRELYDALNAHDIERIKRIAQPNAKMVNVPFGATTDLVEDVRNWLTAFGDAKLEITSLIAQGDLVAVEFIGRGTHTGAFEGPTGSVAPTKRYAELAFCEVYEVRDGKIAGGRMYFDGATLMRNLGIAPEMPMRTGEPRAAPEELRH